MDEELKRVVVLGSTGFFGGVILDRLRSAGLQPIGASRSSEEMRIDANNPDDIRKTEDFARRHQLTVDRVDPVESVVVLSGMIQQFEAAFGVKMPCHVQTLLGTALHGTARKSDIAGGSRFRSVSRFAAARS